MNYQLNDKRALVSGSTAGIGFAIAEALAGKARKSSSTAAPTIASPRRSSASRRRSRRRGSHAFAGDLSDVNQIAEIALQALQ
jgi:NAD(P)-dependent dehydrogenase (short-subunit alcohol dehydrogenase family)